MLALNPVHQFAVDEDGFGKEEVRGGALEGVIRYAVRGQGSVVKLLLYLGEKPYVMGTEKVFDVVLKNDRGAPVLWWGVEVHLVAKVEFFERPQPRPTQVVCLHRAKSPLPAFAHDALVSQL